MYQKFLFLFALTAAVACQKEVQQVAASPQEAPVPGPKLPDCETDSGLTIDAVGSFKANLVAGELPNSYSIRLRWPLDGTEGADTFQILREEVGGGTTPIKKLGPTCRFAHDTEHLKRGKEYRYHLQRISEGGTVALGSEAIKVPTDAVFHRDTILDSKVASRIQPEGRLFLRGARLITQGEDRTIVAAEIHSENGMIESFASPSLGARGAAGGKIVVRARRGFGNLAIRAHGQVGADGAPGSAGADGKVGAQGQHAWLAFDKARWELALRPEVQADPNSYGLSGVAVKSVAMMPDLSTKYSSQDGHGRFYPERVLDLVSISFASDPESNAAMMRALFFCHTPPQAGFRGGNGGAGGVGSAGLAGGRGGDVFIDIAEYDNTDPQNLQVDATALGGAGGKGGPGGPGGAAGPGGPPGKNEHRICDEASQGPDGKAGTPGDRGRDGADGPLGSVCHRYGKKLFGDCAGFDLAEAPAGR